ncbi:unnamed product [Ostreococcus tauri]|uniref:Unnamed product n=1 Tax=Ostreococcus tauri TaxID=70448 RepID=A0A090N4X4_OSTTA|nr:unnamed product [Ostreococcus tauri]OUS47071.1 hypothetical protein BE221DRAFT_191613 [Ostreococcus tauri]CEG01561.1 unnamed product [Ostreococcus tauri]|eukprot:XP_022841033.1 unnamed product [Ostreococcus tauri]
MALGADARGDGRARGTTDDVERNPARGRGDGGASSARGAYAAAMEALARWDFGMGWERAAARFRGVADAAREARDAHLECEATLIAAEIEANSVRRLFSVTEAAVARSSVDAAAFERMTRLPLRLALELGDAISETRAHLVVGDYHALVGNSLLANVEAAMEHYGFARELARSAKLLPLEIEAFRRMRWTMSMKGDIDAAVTLSREILRLARAYEIKRKRGERRARKLKENWYSENWYFGGHENQELYALKELACALRGERCMLSRPKTLSKYQDDAVKTFKDAIETLEEHWGEVKQSFETDPQGAVLMLSLLAHLGDIYDNDLDHTQANHEAAVGYRTKYEALGKNVLGPHVTCKLCDKPVGGLSVEDARVRMTHAWDASHFEHHFHSKCYDGFFEKSNTLACPCSFSSP